MKILLTSIISLLVVIGLLVAWISWMPMSASRVIWPIVEAIAIDDFVGVTTDGEVTPGLFAIEPTGVSTQPVVDAANRFLDTLTEEQREEVLFPVDDSEWQRWANVHISARQGVGFLDMNAEQSDAAFALIRSGLSARGFETARNIMRLEGHLSDLLNNKVEYGEKRYWLTMMGTPSTDQPWGWQLDGHHLVVNFFVLGDQVVMTPTFMGSEPMLATSGPYEGTTILEEELTAGLALINSLTDAQQNVAIVSREKSANNNRGELFNDNAIVAQVGLSLAELDENQRALAEALIQLYTNQMREGHAQIRFHEIARHWEDTYFSWVGATDENAVFYYRIHSPVVLIEYDHQSPIALDGPPEPSRNHVHTVVRTPNGNDYGKDLLRQHLSEFAH